MKLRYQANKGQRTKYRFMGFTTFDHVDNYWFWHYNETMKRWEYGEGYDNCRYSSHQRCRSVRAFRRKLKKAPAGVKFILVSRWRRNDVYGIGSNNKIIFTPNVENSNL